ncbi:MAG: hypothetical protein ACYCS8_18160 [Acidithiobacillus sp.]
MSTEGLLRGAPARS